MAEFFPIWQNFQNDLADTVKKGKVGKKLKPRTNNIDLNNSILLSAINEAISKIKKDKNELSEKWKNIYYTKNNNVIDIQTTKTIPKSSNLEMMKKMLEYILEG